jgi:hypothetical protein
MFIPWIGLFEQVRLADIFIHYDDVQIPQGRSFVSRVQIKTPSGINWLTAPIDRRKSGKLLSQVFFSEEVDWRDKHLKTIHHAYAKAPFATIMLDLAAEIYACSSNNLAEFNINAIQTISDWLGLDAKYDRSSSTNVAGSSTQRLVDLCKFADADVYVTGHGGLKYLNHKLFEENGISVRYMDYKLMPYPQMFGEFTPYVTILDAIGNNGPRVREFLCSESVCWRELSVK